MNESRKCVLCTECTYFTKSDRYCRKLQINWIPEDFGCNQGKEKKRREKTDESISSN